MLIYIYKIVTSSTDGW